MAEKNDNSFVTVYQVWVKRHHDAKWKMRCICNSLDEAKDESKNYKWDGCADIFILEVQSFVFA